MRLVIPVLSAIPLLTLDIPHRLLFPLFSSAPTNSLNLPVLFLVATFSTVSYTFLPALLRIPWRYYWLLLGVLLISSDAIAHIGGLWYLSLGAYKGLWAARAPQVLTDVVRVGAALAVLRESKSSDRLAFVQGVLPLIVLVLGVLLAGPRLPSTPYWVPECYTLQIHGVLLILLARFVPSSALATSGPSAWPLSTTPKPEIKQNSKLRSKARSRPPALPQSRPTSSPLFFIFSILVLLYLAGLPSRTCPSSLLPRPSVFPRRLPPTSRILESRKSLTGMIVVGEEQKSGHWIRYLRADHSFLGGLWIGPSRDIIINEMKERQVSLWEKIDEEEVVRRAESIYTTFVLQEIIRLAGDPTRQAQGRENGLIIGLGVGISARTLHEHGVNLTVVEIDPVVYEFARRYFGVLEPRGEVVLQDAREFLKRKSSVRYDYIIHDVFTGGTVPSLLFTLEFWESLKAVLTPQGLVAINFAGNLESLASRLVLTTIISAFAHCRSFNDGPPASQKFHNLVLICSPSSKVQFRKPVANDYLPYPSPEFRRQILDHFLENELALGRTETAEILRDATAWKLEQAQLESAWTHWDIMKLVLPDEVWVLY